MAEVIQFNCPFCGLVLRLPLALAGQQGPCPACQTEIVAPDPHRGMGARHVTTLPPTPEPEPFRPFAESPPLVPREQEIAANPLEPVVAQRPVREMEPQAQVRTRKVIAPPPPPPQRAVPVLACLLIGLGGVALGYALGARSVHPITTTISSMAKVPTPPPLTEQPAVIPVQVAPRPEIAPIPGVIEPEITPPPVVPAVVDPKAPASEPAKISAAAEASLRAFLEAPDWASRSAHVLSAEVVRNAMESYSHNAPDGPTPYKSISVKQSHIDGKTGHTLFIFYVVTDTFPNGMPVAVKETASGWLVDWPAFIEFRDNLFEKFVEGPADKSGVFHLIVTKPPPGRAANTENEAFASILLQSPLAGTPHLAFVRKSSEIFDTVQTATDSGAPFAPVLEVVKLMTTSGQPYFEIRKIEATDWFPRETASIH